MLFAHLLSLEFDAGSRVISMDALRRRLSLTPDEVLQQVYADHGRERQFQEQYGSVNISALSWNLTTVAAEALAEFSCNPEFVRYIEIRRDFAEEFARIGWRSYDQRPAVAAHWVKNKTWMTPPVFINGSVVSRNSGYHLMEGHTRTAILLGALDQGLIEPKSEHQIWFGTLPS
jgi:hypothetical protein